jgi:Heterokaryon incompatibility protein (HET)
MVYREFYSRPTIWHEAQSLSDQEMLEKAKYLMFAKGWCIHKVNYLSQIFDLNTFLYLARLRNNMQRAANHDQCLDKDSCQAYNVDVRNYRTRHIRDDCNCEMVLMPYDQLVDIIRKGSVPLVSIEEDDDSIGTPKLVLHERGMFSEYTAVSHVWADGLGNFGQNALPACQIRQLKSRIDSLGRGVRSAHRSVRTGRSLRHRSWLFWMDTLCIPVKKEHIELRNKSIDDMASIYVGAKATLVLDAGLMAFSGATDFLSSIICSVWMDRSWTLQEGALSSICVFQFANGQVFTSNNGSYSRFTWRSDGGKPRKLEQKHSARSQKTKDTIPQLKMWSYLEKDFFHIRMRPRFWYQGSLSGKVLCKGFVSAWNALAGRSSTKSEDIYIILANILDLRLEGLRGVMTSEERLYAVTLSLKELPFSLFFNTGRRLDQNRHHYNRWLPAEIGRTLLTSDPTMTIEKDALLIRNIGTGKGDQSIAFYEVSEVIPISTSIYSIQVGSSSESYIFEPFHNDNDFFDTRGFASTYLAVESGIPANGKHSRGAIFYALCDTNDLVFYAPTRVRKGQNTNISTIEHRFNASVVNETSSIRIKRGMHALYAIA